MDRLPPEVRRRARAAYILWRDNPDHPGLDFKRVRTRSTAYSVRIGADWRAIGIRDGDDMLWIWIGSHAEYDQLLKRL